MHRLIRLIVLPLVALAWLALLEGCSTIEPPATEAPVALASYREHIVIGGRFSVTYQHDDKPQSAQGRFLWRQRGDAIDVDLLSPLGQTLARISITPGIASYEQSGQPARVAANAAQLTEQMLGWPLPADGLRHWLQGFSRQPEGLRQAIAINETGGFDAEGWRIRYVSWQSHEAGAHPKRIDLSRLSAGAGDLALRLVIDSWEPR